MCNGHRPGQFHTAARGQVIAKGVEILDVKLHLPTCPERSHQHYWPPLLPPSNTIRANRPVVSPEFVLFLPYPTANVTVSLAFISIWAEYSAVGLAPCTLRNAGSPP